MLLTLSPLGKLVYMDSMLIFLKYFWFFVDDIVDIPIKWKFLLTDEYNLIAIKLFMVFKSVFYEFFSEMRNF